MAQVPRRAGDYIEFWYGTCQFCDTRIVILFHFKPPKSAAECTLRVCCDEAGHRADELFAAGVVTAYAR